MGRWEESPEWTSGTGVGGGVWVAARVSGSDGSVRHVPRAIDDMACHSALCVAFIWSRAVF